MSPWEFRGVWKVKLQRGRACEGAEIRGWLFSHPLTPNQLQRGRACEGAEIYSARLRQWIPDGLQRGRACEGAEMLPVSFQKDCNPYASTGPRL